MTNSPQGDSSNPGSAPGDHAYGAGSGYPGGYATQSGYAVPGGYAASPYQPTGGYPGDASGGTGPPSNVGWAVASIIFFWPLAFVAMTRALDVYPLWAAGRHAEAEAASATAKKLGMISIAILVLLIVLYVAFLLVMVAVAASTGY